MGRTLFSENCSTFRVLPKNSCLAIIGSGVEENRNGSEPMTACLAAPRGICNGSMNGQPVLFIADSNSSSIRVVTLRDGHVANLVGGDADPTVRSISRSSYTFKCFFVF